MDAILKLNKSYVIKERDVSLNSNTSKLPTSLSLNRKNLSFYNINKDYVSPFARKTRATEATIKYADPIISGIDQLEMSQDRNVQLEGWSAQDIKSHREELLKNIKPETLAALKCIQEKKRNLPKKEESNEEKLLSSIKVACKESQKENIDIKEEANDKKDLSFMPIAPSSKLLNMNKVEFDKLEWMKHVESKTENAKSISIRFHVNGQVMQPEMGIEEEEFMKLTNEEFDPYADSLRHHGEEPSREGYTINELFWLARSSFPQQRHLAVTALINMVMVSKKLEHAHQFNVTTITQNLVDCGILFLARWLIDDAKLRENQLEDAFKLLKTIVVSESSDEETVINWPELAMASSQPRLMSNSSSEAELSRKKLPLSERTEIHDDVLMNEDIISCLVLKTHLLTRISWIISNGHFVSTRTESVVLEILQRIAEHSLEMASNLCHEHELLLTRLLKSHLNIQSALFPQLLRLLRVIANSSQSMAYKLTKDKNIISAVFNAVSETDTNMRAKIEAVRLSSVLISKEIHLGPIVEFTPILVEWFIANIQTSDTNCLLIQAIAMFLSSLVSSSAVIPPTTFSLINEAAHLCQAHIIRTIQSQPSFIFSSLICFCNTFFLHQYSSTTVSSNDTTLEFWDQFVYPLLQSKILPIIYHQVSSNTILGYEHCNPSLQLVRLDLHNMLQYSSKLAAQTANPEYVDLKPFFIHLHPSVSVLSALSHTLRAVASTKINQNSLPNFSYAFSDLMNNDSLTRYLMKVSESPPGKVVPSSSPYSAIVQLELETVCQVMLTIVSISSWTGVPLSSSFATIIYRVATKILPHLGVDLQFLVPDLVRDIVFSPSILDIVATSLPQEMKTALLTKLPSIINLYTQRIPSFEKSVSPQSNLSLKKSVDKFVIAHDWIELPITELYQIQKRSPELEVDSQSTMNSLIFLMFLELDNILPTKTHAVVGLYRLSYMLSTIDWIQCLSDDINRTVVTSLMRLYLSQPSLIDISATHCNTLSFYNLYDDLIQKYFYDSLSDPCLANIIMFPCAMRFPTKYRQFLWGEYSSNLRLLTIDISESIFPIDEYLYPEEKNCTILRSYWRGVRDRDIHPESNPLLYWICVHHLNRFIYRQNIVCESDKERHDLKASQRGFGTLISDSRWISKPWVQHIRLYKHFQDNGPQFYENLPVNRQQHLEKLCKEFKK